MRRVVSTPSIRGIRIPMRTTPALQVSSSSNASSPPWPRRRPRCRAGHPAPCGTRPHQVLVVEERHADRVVVLPVRRRHARTFLRLPDTGRLKQQRRDDFISPTVLGSGTHGSVVSGCRLAYPEEPLRDHQSIAASNRWVCLIEAGPGVFGAGESDGSARWRRRARPGAGAGLLRRGYWPESCC